MTRVERLKIFRSLTTTIFAAVIFLCDFFIPDLHLSLPLTVFCSCLLGSVQGASAVGISAIIYFIVKDFDIGAMTEAYTGLFVGALITGILAGRPSIYEKTDKRKIFIKCLIGALVSAIICFAAYFLITHDSSFFRFIALDTAKAIAAAVVGVVLRPMAAEHLFPPDAEEEELDAAIEKFRKK